ncbi:exosortase K [Desulfogranum japonicum]|uniref:exosortase K n=1 Tax=Desulfogranum japonicum TaxID=231447 RepID=UPI0004234B97|nr:exosortase K [Desulfogranum japonicum]
MNLYRQITQHPARIWAGCCVLLFALILKLWFSSATPAQLCWLLGPIAKLIQLYTSVQFTFDPHLGYVNQQLQIIIAPVCCGLNFMLIVLCMVAFQGIITLNSSQLWKWLLVTPLLAYTYTILVNSVRIILAIWLFKHHMEAGWLTPERVHRLSGILIYYLMLLFLYNATTILLEKIEQSAQTCSSQVLALFPFFWYAGMTLVIPLLNRNSYTLRYWEHSASILCMCIVLTTAYSLSRKLWQSYRSSGKHTNSHGQTPDLDC